MDTLFIVALASNCALGLIGLWVRFRQQAAIPGSYKKYQFTTLLIIVMSLKVLAGIGIVVSALTLNHMPIAGIWALIVAIDAWDVKKLLNDDNWFNNQYKRLKRGLKNLQTRLSMLASPMPAPA